MQHVHTYSLEEAPIGIDGHVQLPSICGECYNALMPHGRGRTSRRSHAALATSPYTYQVVDWKGLGTSSCHYCRSNRYSERFSVEVHRRTKG